VRILSLPPEFMSLFETGLLLVIILGITVWLGIKFAVLYSNMFMQRALESQILETVKVSAEKKEVTLYEGRYVKTYIAKGGLKVVKKEIPKEEEFIDALFEPDRGDWRDSRLHTVTGEILEEIPEEIHGWMDEKDRKEVLGEEYEESKTMPVSSIVYPVPCRSKDFGTGIK
jgi:hypothetical protein